MFTDIKTPQNIMSASFPSIRCYLILFPGSHLHHTAVPYARPCSVEPRLLAGLPSALKDPPPCAASPAAPQPSLRAAAPLFSLATASAPSILTPPLPALRSHLPLSLSYVATAGINGATPSHFGVSKICSCYS
ncbi:unnamed protein product [Urochloa humidicola]